jgi:hypothetical protein
MAIVKIAALVVRLSAHRITTVATENHPTEHVTVLGLAMRVGFVGFDPSMNRGNRFLWQQRRHGGFDNAWAIDSLE